MQDSKILFLLLDAFRGDYINPVDTPFLHSKTSKGIYADKMKSSASFTHILTSQLAASADSPRYYENQLIKACIAVGDTAVY
jgi:hypothetical protein